MSAISNVGAYQYGRRFDFENLPGSAPVKYFTPDEFDSGDGTGGGEKMSESLIRKLDLAREIAGIPIHIESGYRSPDRNVAIGGAKNSAHVTFEAADTDANTPQTRYRLLRAFFAVGFDRMEIKPGDIHVDVAHDDLHPAGIVLFQDTKTGKLV